MVRKLFTVVLLALAAILISIPAGASLVPMSWGFPTLVQDHTLTAFENNLAESSASESAAVAFPTSAGSFCGTSAFGSAFPTITQSAAKDDFLMSNKFMQEKQSMAFAYPWLSIGGSPVPSMGFL
ncbi:hypothetical protein [Methanocella sp. MCL-LM]|uniref:hypothetical protein n=1 Tax=Methanocella sp. MCL-LM TaxID=3412035 RepID=UPI003C7578AB